MKLHQLLNDGSFAQHTEPDEGPRESADDRLPENPDAVGALAEVLASNKAMRTQLAEMRTHARLAKDALGKGDRLSGELHASILLEMAAAGGAA